MGVVRITPRVALRGPVGNGRENHPDDVLAVKRRLHGLGLYREPDYGFNGYVDRDTETGIRALQKQQGLKIDGWLAPGGETAAAIDALSSRSELTGSLGAVAGSSGYRRPLWPDEAASEGGQPKVHLAAAANDGAGIPAGPAILMVDKWIRRYAARRAAEEAASAATSTTPRDLGRVVGNPGRAIARRVAAEAVDDGIVYSDRGGEQTQADVNRAANICKAIAQELYPDQADDFEHIGGGTANGEGAVYLKEKYLPNLKRKALKLDPRPGSSNPDLAFRNRQIMDENAPGAFWYGNSQSTLADGKTPTKWERESLKRLIDNAPGQFVTSVPKRPDGMSDEDYDKMLADFCADGLRKLFGPPRIRN